MSKLTILFFIFYSLNVFAAPAPFEKCEDLTGWDEIPKCDVLFGGLQGTESRIIKGKVSTFHNIAIEKPCIFLFAKKQGDVVCAYSGKLDGSFEFIAPKKYYHSLAVMQSFAINYLETWIHNIHPSEDVVLNDLRIGQMEVYGITPKETQDSFTISFAPWSLFRYKKGYDLNDLTPSLTIQQIKIYVDGKKLENISILDFNQETGQYTILTTMHQPIDFKSIRVVVENNEYGYEVGESRFLNFIPLQEN